MHSHLLVRSLLLTTLSIPGLATAQNFLANGDFDTAPDPIADWTVGGSQGDGLYKSDAGSPTLGSEYLHIHDASGGGLTEDVDQCVQIVPGVSFTFSGRTLLDSANTTSAGSGMFVLGRFYASRDCTTSILSTSLASPAGTAAGTPAAFSVQSLTISSPAGTHSFRLYVTVQSGGAGDAYGWVDHLSLTSPDLIFFDGFD